MVYKKFFQVFFERKQILAIDSIESQVILYSGKPLSHHVTSLWDGLSQYICKDLIHFI